MTHERQKMIEWKTFEKTEYVCLRVAPPPVLQIHYIRGLYILPSKTKTTFSTIETVLTRLKTYVFQLYWIIHFYMCQDKYFLKIYFFISTFFLKTSTFNISRTFLFFK